MDFRYSEEQDMMRRIARDFAQTEIVPYAAEWDKNHVYPRATLSSMGNVGLLTLGVPSEYGGAGLDHVSKNLVTEEIARGDAGIATALAASTLLGSYPVLLAATPEQKQWWYGMEMEGCLTALCLRRADVQADPGMMGVRCHRRGDEYILNGRHQSVSNGAGAGLYTVFASLDNRLGVRGSCAFMVDRNSRGIGVEATALTSLPSSGCACVTYDEVRVPALNLLGKEGDGLELAARTRNIDRVTGAAIAVGLAQATFETLVQYSLQRYQSGKPIFELPEVHLLLADMARWIEAGRLSHLMAAHMLEGGSADEETVCQTQYLCGDIAIKSAQEALQVYGGPGWSQEWPAEKYLRDARMLKCGLEQPSLKNILSPAI
jgi:alkylation response protein AidB-like acyl-CoA dehydrogenase